MLIHQYDDWPLYIAVLAVMVVAILVFSATVALLEQFPGDVRIPILALEAVGGLVSLLAALVRWFSRRGGH